MNLVLDTNVLVSALWSPGKNASVILNAVLSRKYTACYDHRILQEISFFRMGNLLCSGTHHKNRFLGRRGSAA